MNLEEKEHVGLPINMLIVRQVASFAKMNCIWNDINISSWRFMTGNQIY